MANEVNIRIEGIIPLLFRHAGNRIVECFIGGVRNVPDHFFSFLIKKNGAPVNPGTVLDDLHLQVTNTSQTDITLLRDDISRIDRITGQGDQQSFAWVLDFEGAEVYGRGIGFDRRQLGPTLRINQGMMFTTEISPNHLLKRLPNDRQWTFIGKVATKIRAQIDLDNANSEAILINGNSQVQDTRTRRGELLEIEIKVSRNHVGGGSHPDDANNYHRAIGPGLQAPERFIFKSTPVVPGLPATPDASCLSGRMGTTEGG